MMNITWVKAAELPEVCALYQAAIADMQARGLEQWAWGRYPTEAILAEDVALSRLYRVDQDGSLIAVFALCVGQDAEYEGVGWRYGVRPACRGVVAVGPPCR